MISRLVNVVNGIEMRFSRLSRPQNANACRFSYLRIDGGCKFGLLIPAEKYLLQSSKIRASKTMLISNLFLHFRVVFLEELDNLHTKITTAKVVMQHGFSVWKDVAGNQTRLISKKL
jgi:hypothetical protein